MIIKTKPTPNLNVTDVRIPAGDISLDTGIRLLAELLNPDGLIIDKKYIEIPQLPNIVVNNQEIPAFEFLKDRILQVLALEEDEDSTSSLA